MPLRATLLLRHGYRTLQRWLSGPVEITPGTPQARRVELAGIVLVCATAVLFACCDAIAKLLSGSVSPVQIMWARFIFFWLALILVMGPTRCVELMQAARPKPQLLRSALVLPSVAFIVLALKYIPLADATVIAFTSPFLVTLLSALLMGERLRFATMVSITGGFIGVLIVLRPGAGLLSWYALLPLGTAVFAALYQLLTRHLSRTTPAKATLFQTTFYCSLASSVAVCFSWVPPDLTGWVLLVLSGLVYGLAQTLMILAFAMAAPGVLAPFLYVQLLAALFLDFSLFAHVPGWNTLVGIVVVVGSGLYMLRNLRRR